MLKSPQVLLGVPTPVTPVPLGEIGCDRVAVSVGTRVALGFGVWVCIPRSFSVAVSHFKRVFFPWFRP